MSQFINVTSQLMLLMKESGVKLFNVSLINSTGLLELILRFLFTALIIFIVVHFMYARSSKRKDFYFSFLSVGIIVFLLGYLLSNVKLELGFALGLFAIFGIIRYRTDAIPIKEMTYLFVIIGISIINALSVEVISYAELLFSNAVIIMFLWILEKRLSLVQEHSIKVIYEKIENIHTANYNDLMEDLRHRTGINITRFSIIKIDLLKDVAELCLFYHENGHQTKTSKDENHEEE